MTDDTIPPFSFPAVHAKKVTESWPRKFGQ
ncbi:hypothetical protein ABIF91_007154 [Bradyrhizobium sp. USDA 241]